MLTPFNRHHSPLPSSEGIGTLRPFVSELLATNASAARRSLLRTALQAASDGAAPLSAAIPAGWAASIRKHPAWLGALHPALIDPPQEVKPQDAIPSEWLSDLRTQPWLVELLRPELLKDVPLTAMAFRGPLEDHCRLSFYFDDKGNEITGSRYAGSQTGPCEI